MRVIYVLGKQLDVSRPGLEEARRYRMVSKLTLAVSWVRVSVAQALDRDVFFFLFGLVRDRIILI